MINYFLKLLKFLNNFFCLPNQSDNLNKTPFLFKLCVSRVGNFFILFAFAFIFYLSISFLFNLFSFLLFNTSKAFFFFKYGVNLHVKNKAHKKTQSISNNLFSDQNDTVKYCLNSVLFHFYCFYFYIQMYIQIFYFSLSKKNQNNKNKPFVDKKSLVELIEKRDNIFLSTLGFISPFQTLLFFIINTLFNLSNFMFDNVFFIPISNYFLSNFFTYKLFYFGDYRTKEASSLIPILFDVFLFTISLLLLILLLHLSSNSEKNVFNNIIKNITYNSEDNKFTKNNILNKSQMRLFKVQYQNRENMIFDMNYKEKKQFSKYDISIQIIFYLRHLLMGYVFLKSKNSFFNYFYISGLPYEIVDNCSSMDIMNICNHSLLSGLLIEAVYSIQKFAKFLTKKQIILFVANENNILKKEYMILI